MGLASQKLIILTSGAEIWQHLTGFKDPEECLSVHIRLSRDNRALLNAQGVRELVSQSLGHALTSRLHGKAFALEASLRLTSACCEERCPVLDRLSLVCFSADVSAHQLHLCEGRSCQSLICSESPKRSPLENAFAHGVDAVNASEVPLIKCWTPK